MKVSILGAGYVGLVTGACLAETGHDVVCVDIDKNKVEKINQAETPIFEKGLAEILSRTIHKNFRATTDIDLAIHESEMTMVAVGTPFDGSEIDLSYIKKAAEDIGRVLRNKPGYHSIVIKSTVVPGTTEQIVTPIVEKESRKKCGTHFGVGMNPEFLTEGQAVSDFMKPDRIVLGASDEKTMLLLEELYAKFNNVTVVKTNCKSAEMIKYTSNAMLALQISFSNEIANMCSALGGIDIQKVFYGLHLSNYLTPFAEDGSRIRAPISAFLLPGCGFGGSCLPKDVKAIIAHGEKAGSPMPILNAVIETNLRQPEQIVKLLQRHFPSLDNIKIAILGLSFRPNTDDMRESPAITIISKLLSRGVRIKAYDPIAIQNARRIFYGNDVQFCENLKDAISDVDAAVLVTRWDEFNSIPEMVKEHNPDMVFIDGRGMFDAKSFNKYETIGR